MICPKGRRVSIVRRGRCAAVRRQEPFIAQPGVRPFRRRRRRAESPAGGTGAAHRLAGDRRPARRHAARAHWLKARQPLFTTAAPRALRSLIPCAPTPRGRRPSSAPVAAVAIDSVDRPSWRDASAYFTQTGRTQALLDIACAPAVLQGAGIRGGGAGSCLAYQLGKCKGPAPARTAHPCTTRLQLALSSLKLKAWPFRAHRIARRRAARLRARTVRERRPARGRSLDLSQHRALGGELAARPPPPRPARSMSTCTGSGAVFFRTIRGSIGWICAK